MLAAPALLPPSRPGGRIAPAEHWQLEDANTVYEAYRSVAEENRECAHLLRSFSLPVVANPDCSTAALFIASIHKPHALGLADWVSATWRRFEADAAAHRAEREATTRRFTDVVRLRSVSTDVFFSRAVLCAVCVLCLFWLSCAIWWLGPTWQQKDGSSETIYQSLVDAV